MVRPVMDSAGVVSGRGWIEELKVAIGSGSVVDDVESRRAYSKDSWPISILRERTGDARYLPDAIALPGDIEAIAATIRLAHRHGLAVTPRGLGSSVSGQPLTVSGGIILDTSRLVGEPQFNPIDLLVTIGPGVKGSDLESWLNDRGYTLNHLPQSLGRSSVGGWLATRATGQLSSRFGGIEELVSSYRVMLSDGSLVDMGAKPRSAVGPDLNMLFLGSEGTLGIIVEVTMKVFPLPETRLYGSYVMPRVGAGLAAMREVMQKGLSPALLRFYDEAETALAAPTLSGSGCVLFMGHEGLHAVTAAEQATASSIIEGHGGKATGPEPVTGWLEHRFDFSMIESWLLVPGCFAETIEVAHHWSGIEDLYVQLREGLGPVADVIYGHFSHAYHSGVSLYVIVLGRAGDDGQAIERLESVWEAAMEVTLAAGGELSHHHGAGLARVAYVARALGPRHDILRAIKRHLDPDGTLNPGKLGLD